MMATQAEQRNFQIDWNHHPEIFSKRTNDIETEKPNQNANEKLSTDLRMDKFN